MVEQSVLVLEKQGPNPVLSEGIHDWVFECHGLLHNAVLIIASFLFVLYLALQAKKSFLRLSHGRSYIIISYYASLWLVSILNLLWCFSQAWECSPGKEFAWNLLSLFTTSGMLFLEVSLLAFLLQGNSTSGLEALTRTFGISGIIVIMWFYSASLQLVLMVINAIYLFAFGIPIFINSGYPTPHVKWNLWVIHKLLLTLVYGFILFMYHSRWRERLPARPAYYKYVTIMFILNAIALFACGITGNGAAFGFWLYHFTVVCYHAAYLPLLYITFLADFFQEEDLHLENVYYSEMKDAGFFEADWN
ncbi:hypothetical protein GmHk_10G029396 [Glycine max]|nr:hypothetical protein GmHk_10G029396 [Glycine max]